LSSSNRGVVTVHYQITVSALKDTMAMTMSMSSVITWLQIHQVFALDMVTVLLQIHVYEIQSIKVMTVRLSYQSSHFQALNQQPAHLH
jgi:hypothetical protein